VGTRPNCRFWGVLVGQGLTSAVLLYAALLKLISGPGQVVAALSAARLLGRPASLATARALPWIELLLGLWLLTGIRKRAASVFVGLILIAFSAFLFVLGSRTGWSNHCGCIGALDPANIAVSLLRNGLLLVLTLTVFFFSRPAKSSGASSAPTAVRG
jgi:uncharacterized membrane protein YphA (DoxX/SURF4 family)